jgi:hypothetical protein
MVFLTYTLMSGRFKKGKVLKTSQNQSTVAHNYQSLPPCYSMRNLKSLDSEIKDDHNPITLYKTLKVMTFCDKI